MKTDRDEPITAGRFQITTKFDGGQASGPKDCVGLTKREYFAALAMQGLLAAVYSDKEMLSEFTTSKHTAGTSFGMFVSGCKAVSVNAVSYADALIAELNKPKETGDE